MIKLADIYQYLPERFYQIITPAKFKAPKLLKFNYELAKEIDLDLLGTSEDDLTLIFSGQKVVPGSRPIALAYGAHQFGHFVPQLGDGRAHLLGQSGGQDIQLKGSGQTIYSRNGDGRSALGPVIREYIVSEAMHHLGVSTTRALATTITGEQVLRNGYEPGGIFTRVAPSHIRVGTFQYFAFRQDREALERLLKFAINRHFPYLDSIKSISDLSLAFLKEVALAQANLVAHWMSLGFIHGVMNTDNFSVGGFTLDFGPCAFMDEYKEDKVFSSIDRNGRYAYNNQIKIAQWNILRLADCLLPFIDRDEDVAINKVQNLLAPIFDKFEVKRWEYMSRKFGIKNYSSSDIELMSNFLKYLENYELDFTLSFRNLTSLFAGDTSFFPQNEDLANFLRIWKTRVSDVEQLNLVNPLFIPRNHQVERAIQSAYKGDYQIFEDMVEVLKNPYNENAKYSEYSAPPKEEERITKTFCGT